MTRALHGDNGGSQWSPRLVLCNVAMATVSFADLVGGAVAGEFDAISLLGTTHRRAALKEGLTARDMRHLLDDHGVGITDVEAVGDWLGPPPTDGPKWLACLYPAEAYLDIAAELGAATVVAVHFGAPAPIETAVQRFGLLCDDAASRDLDVALEFPAFATIADVRTAWDVVRLADRANGGILVDTWHHRRGSNDDAALAQVDGARVLSVQLADAAGEVTGPLVADVMYRRLPGEGDFGLVALMRSLAAQGVRAPVGIEVFDVDLLKQGPEAAAKRLGASLRHVVDEALG